MSLCAEISAQMGSLFSCVPQGEFTKIRTPFLYPDGDVIDVFAKERDGSVTLTDLGESMRWLKMQSAATSRRSARQRALIQDVCQTHGIEIHRGMLISRVPNHELLADHVTRLSQAALRLADVWFTLRGRSITTVVDEVSDFLRERSIDFQRSVKLVGRSARPYTLDFQTRTPELSALVLVLSTPNRSGARSMVEHAFTTWSDLSHMKGTIGPSRFVSLFDDTQDVWSNEDIALVNSVSDPAMWSQPDALDAMLRAA